MKRLLTGEIRGSDDLPIANRKIIFIRDKGSYTPASQYVSDVIEAYTDSLGVIKSIYLGVEAGGVWLWTNEIGELPTTYNCIMGSGVQDAFTFTLPPASTPITISEVRQNSQPIPEPEYNTLINYVTSAIAAHNLDPSAHPNMSGGSGGVSVAFSYGDATPKKILDVVSGVTVFKCSLYVETPFNGAGSSLILRDNDGIDLLIASYEIIKNVSSLETSVIKTYTAINQINLLINNSGGNTTGSGFVKIEV
jgi:hypothetical protein